MTRNHRLFSLVAATLVACGGTPTPVDGGMTGDAGNDTGATTNDAGSDAGGSGGACASAMAVTLAAGAQSVMGDTTGMTTGLVDLGANCGGNMAGQMQAPEQVIAVTLPGSATDNVAVTYTLLNAVTDAMFDTTTQVRTNCMDATGAICFDDSSVDPADYRSDGHFTAPGGSTRYIIISGYRMPLTGYHNSGPWKADFQTFVNPTAPTLASGTASLLDGDYLTVEAVGMDPQSAATGVQLSFLDATSAPIGFDIDADPTTADVTDLGPYDFRPGIIGMMNFDGTSRVTGFGPFPQALTATQLRIAVVDAANLTSNEIMIPLVQSTSVHVGDMCDAMSVCPPGVDCTGTPAVCTVPAAVATECAGAVAVTVATPTTTTTMATSSVNFTTGTGLIEGSCIGTGGMGDEHILSVDVPATGTFDLIAETPDMAENGPDTLIYDRTVCGDPSTETACNDDRGAAPDPHVIASRIVVQNAAAGTHFIIVDSFETMTTAMSTVVTISLRPVLAVGDMCDSAGVMNRCPGTPCPATGTGVVCP
jgi:hypothetical protein